ncbi:hypothetical protein AX14_000771 [Amanita brunnescens Koide BX004]|nr:hypothetical protein AX14_000771 [Amanita brunnescens Koide BX004]
MDLYAGPPPGLTRPKTSPPPPNTSSATPPAPSCPNVASPVPRRATSIPWASSLAAGLFPATFPMFSAPPQVPHGLLPSNAAVQPVVDLHNNNYITDLGAGVPTPNVSDPWHRAHARVCAHAATPCAACSVALFCCTCRALRFTPGPPPVSPSGSTGPSRRTHSVSPALFRMDVGNGTPPPEFDSHEDDHDDNTYTRALAESDTCDNSSCPRGANEPATYSITVEQFDEGSEETYERILRACSTCNRSCRKSFMGHRIKARVFDNSAREAFASKASVPGSTSYVNEHPVNPATSPKTPAAPLSRTSPNVGSGNGLRQDLPLLQDAVKTTPEPTSGDSLAHEQPTPPPNIITVLRDSLRILSNCPPTPAAFVAAIRVKHDALCQHHVGSCATCSLGLLCCSCTRMFAPAVARHLACENCKHIASSCCATASCCNCNKFWMPTDSIGATQLPARRFYGGAGPLSSPEPDIWTPSPRSSPDEIDDLTACAALPLPASRSESDASWAPSRASSVDEPVNVAATPLSTPDYASLPDESVDGFIHPSFPE